MRLILFLFVTGLFVFSSCSTTSKVDGMSKEEVKEWKDKARQYVKNPDALKALTESRELYQEEASRFEARLNDARAQTTQFENQIAQLEQENTQLTNNLMTAQQTIQQLSEENEELAARGPVTTPEEDMSGTVFRVQIGAFERNRLPEDLDTGENMDFEMDDGMQKILVGKYRSLEEAKQLMNYLQRIGVQGAWVVPFVDGQRVPLRQVLQN